MSRSTYYYQLKRLEKPDKYSEVKEQIKKIFEHNKGRYGYRRVHVILRQQGMTLNHKTTQRLMASMKLQGKQSRNKYRMTLLSPEIIHAIIAGTLEKDLGIEQLKQAMPLMWNDQKKMFDIE